MIERLSDLQVLAPAALEAETRPIRSTELKVIDYKPPSNDPATHLSPAGSITVFIAPKGARILRDVRKAAKSSNPEKGRAIVDWIRAQSRMRKELPLSEAVEKLRVQAVFADIRHGGVTLATNLCTPEGVDVCVAPLPYNGGKLAKLLLVEHYRDKKSPQLEAVALRHTPPLTKAERAALRLVPSDQVELNLGHIVLCFALSAIAAAFLLTMAGTCGTSLIGEDSEEDHLAEAKIRELGPGATARQLLQIRRAILERSS